MLAIAYIGHHNRRQVFSAALVRRPVDDIVLAEVAQARRRSAIPIDISNVSGAQVVGHADDLGRVVRNLLDNAGRHAAARVTVSLGQVGRFVELVVADDGAGVLAADRERVFERFTRLDDARSRDTGGSGLGLAIVREVVVSHGGTITVEPGEPGARFVVRLPRGDGHRAR